MEAGNSFELPYWEKGQFVIGLDEAGRGPIAGPVVVAGVVFPIGYTHEGIYDSKKLSEKKRNELFEVIKKDALAYVIRIVDRKEIDASNIYKVTQEAMQSCVDKINVEIHGVLSDAMPLPNCKYPVDSLVKGDQLSISIAAASICAKVTRDKIMQEYDRVYPGYDFSSHKGYGTKKHIEALHTLGVSPIHRTTFEPVKSMVTPTLFDL